MVKVTFVDTAGQEHPVDVPEGTTLMEAGRDANVPGIIGECGGFCACATCMVHIHAPWSERIPAPAADETSMIGGALLATPDSRLGCQVMLNATLDDMIVEVAADE